VLDEAVLHRMVGGQRVMAAQLGHIIDTLRLSNVTVQVIPYAIGAHPAVESNFNILELPEPAPNVIFVEGLVGSIYLERAEDLVRYSQIFERLQQISLDPKETADLIAKLQKKYRSNLISATEEQNPIYCDPTRIALLLSRFTLTTERSKITNVLNSFGD
jgi:xanthosine utilization system XapX-like protein